MQCGMQCRSARMRAKMQGQWTVDTAFGKSLLYLSLPQPQCLPAATKALILHQYSPIISSYLPQFCPSYAPLLFVTAHHLFYSSSGRVVHRIHRSMHCHCQSSQWCVFAFLLIMRLLMYCFQVVEEQQAPYGSPFSSNFSSSLVSSIPSQPTRYPCIASKYPSSAQ